MNLGKLSGMAKGLIDKRGGMGALKKDAAELKDIATGAGSVGDKAKRAAEAIKDPGARGPEAAPRAEGEEAAAPRVEGEGTPAPRAGGTPPPAP